MQNLNPAVLAALNPAQIASMLIRQGTPEPEILEMLGEDALAAGYDLLIAEKEAALEAAKGAVSRARTKTDEEIRQDRIVDSMIKAAYSALEEHYAEIKADEDPDNVYDFLADVRHSVIHKREDLRGQPKGSFAKTIHKTETLRASLCLRIDSRQPSRK